MDGSKRSQIKSERQTFDGFALGDCMLQLSPHDFTATASLQYGRYFGAERNTERRINRFDAAILDCNWMLDR